MAELKNQALGNYAWMRIIERAHLPQQVKTVAFILGINANADGSNARIGEARLADTAINTVRYAQECISILKLLGLIEITKYGRLAGDANTYQLTTPGGHLPAVQMRRDPNGKPTNLDGSPRTGVLSKPLSVRPLLALLQGEPLPARPMPVDRTGNPVPEQEPPASAEGSDRTGNPVPLPDPSTSEQNSGRTGNPVPEPDPAPPVDNPDRTGNPVPPGPVDTPEVTGEYRQPGAATDPTENEPYRQRVADVSATGCGRTGNPVPPTNSYQLLPTNSPQATTSPTPNDQACGQADDEPEQQPPAPDERDRLRLERIRNTYLDARAVLDALPRAEREHWTNVAIKHLSELGEDNPNNFRIMTVTVALRHAARQPPDDDTSGTP